jgi:hypothetical protein
MTTNLPLTCPCKLKSNLLRVEEGFVCQNEECEHFKIEDMFPMVNETPVLVSEKRCDTVCIEGTNQTYIERPLSGFLRIKKLIVGESKTTKSNCRLFIEELISKNKRSKVLMIGLARRDLGLKNYGITRRLKFTVLISMVLNLLILYVMLITFHLKMGTMMEYGFKQF